MIVKDLRNSFNPCPKIKSDTNKKKQKIKQKSSKLTKKEKERFSILQENKTKCFLCGKYFERLDKHEAFGGSNRQKSMEWGLVYYLCRKCHTKAEIERVTKKYLQDYARNRFIKSYSKEKFLKEFGKNYI